MKLWKAAVLTLALSLCVSTTFARRSHFRPPPSHPQEDSAVESELAQALEQVEVLEEGKYIEYSAGKCEGCLIGFGSPTALAREEFFNLIEKEGDQDGPTHDKNVPSFRFASVSSGTALNAFTEFGIGFLPGTLQKKERIFDVKQAETTSRIVGGADSDLTRFHLVSEVYSEVKASGTAKYIPALPELSASMGLDFTRNSESLGLDLLCKEEFREISIKSDVSLNSRLSSDFKRAVAKLKNVPYDPEHPENYFSFFSIYGTHYFHSVMLGGLIRLKDSEEMTVSDLHGKLSADATIMPGALTVSGSVEGKKKSTRNVRSLTGQVFGGDHNLAGIYRSGFSLGDRDIMTPESQDSLKKWAESVRAHKGALAVPIEYGYQPIHNLITEEQGKQEFAKALDDYVYGMSELQQRHVAMKQIQQAIIKYSDRIVYRAPFWTRILVHKHFKWHIRKELSKLIPLAFDLHKEVLQRISLLHLKNSVFGRVLLCFQFHLKRGLEILHRDLNVKVGKDEDGNIAFFRVDSIFPIPAAVTRGDKRIHNTAPAIRDLFDDVPSLSPKNEQRAAAAAAREFGASSSSAVEQFSPEQEAGSAGSRRHMYDNPAFEDSDEEEFGLPPLPEWIRNGHPHHSYDGPVLSRHDGEEFILEEAPAFNNLRAANQIRARGDPLVLDEAASLRASAKPSRRPAGHSDPKAASEEDELPSQLNALSLAKRSNKVRPL